MAEAADNSEHGPDPGKAGFGAPLPNTVSVQTPPSLHDRSTVASGRILPFTSPVAHVLGERYGKYELVEQVAAGGMGVVYKARDTVLDRIVALKTIRTGVLAQPAEVDRFYLEARAAA